MELDPNGLRILDRAECLRLLGSQQLGRVGTSHRALPVILPVSYALLDDCIVFNVTSGMLLKAAQHNDIVCFEVDEVDSSGACGWSVVATGQLCEVESSHLAARAADVTVPRWSPNEGRLLWLSTTFVSGRQTVH